MKSVDGLVVMMAVSLELAKVEMLEYEMAEK